MNYSKYLSILYYYLIYLLQIIINSNISYLHFLSKVKTNVLLFRLVNIFSVLEELNPNAPCSSKLN